MAAKLRSSTMARPAPKLLDDEDTISVPRRVVLPVELRPPEDFDPDDARTWPRVEGRLEWVGGRLLWMPPCGDEQQDTVADVVTVLGLWSRKNPEFVVGTNEAGLRLGDDTRAADAAVWRREDVGPYRKKFRRVPPLLAVEVAGGDEEPEAMLLDKAGWYLRRGVPVVWIVLPAVREIVVVTARGQSRHGIGERLPGCPALPHLRPRVAECVRQVAASRPGRPRRR